LVSLERVLAFEGHWLLPAESVWPLLGLVFDRNNHNAASWDQPDCHILGKHQDPVLSSQLSGKTGSLQGDLDHNVDIAWFIS
jgi:hypothetical protein